MLRKKSKPDNYFNSAKDGPKPGRKRKEGSSETNIVMNTNEMRWDSTVVG